MSYCAICGDEDGARYPGRPWWSPDDGWHHGALCPSCLRAYGSKRPQEGDYAWELRRSPDLDLALAENDEM